MTTNDSLQQLKIMRAVALECDSLYERVQALGNVAGLALGNAKRSQITGLESIANSALKVGDVRDYLKLRTARQREWQTEGAGQQVLTFIEQDLGAARSRVCKMLNIEDPGQRQAVYLMLIREFVRQLAAHYEFVVKFGPRATPV